MADDVASGVWYYLTSLTDLMAVVGAFPADDPSNPNVPFVFVRNIYTRMEDLGIVKGTGAVALVCANAGPSVTPLDYSTMRPQKLEVDIWVDPLRDAYGNITNPSETESRGNSVFTLLDSYLHRAPLSDKLQQWGDLITINSVRMAEPQWYAVPDGDGLIRGACYYDVSTYGNYDPTVCISGGDSGGGGEQQG